jgi:hypothetical protein
LFRMGSLDGMGFSWVGTSDDQSKCLKQSLAESQNVDRVS